MRNRSEDIKEKHLDEIKSFVREQDKLTDQLISIKQRTRSTLNAVEKFINAIKDENNLPGIFVKSGELCFEFGLKENARLFFERAIATDPANSDAYNNIGVLYFQDGEIKTAEEYFAKAIKLDPGHAYALENMSLLHGSIAGEENKITSPSEENLELYDMKAYWDSCARDNAMRHIACDDWQSEEVFNTCGEKDLANLLNNVDGDFLEDDHKRVLEIGCGIGRLIRPLAIKKPAWGIYGIDVSDEMIRKGRLRMRDLENIKLYASNGKDLGMFDEEYFDLIYSYIVFQHIPRKFVYNYFNEINRVLVKGGLLVFQMPLIPENMVVNEPPDTDFRTLRCYSIEGVHAMCRSNNFKITRTVPIGRHENYSISSAWFTAVKN